ncbi:MAG: hypothetical protein FWG65_00860 [Turicibacter sp.]|nr:hypothetical protein [Turicibacter sp.]
MKVKQTREPSKSANREIKDGVFKILFEDPENAAELHTALTGIPCTADEVQIFKITTIVSGKIRNDLGLLVGGRIIFLGEHMSTLYANMPVRCLIYVADSYDRLIKMRGEERFIYNSKLYKIPKPQFVVFYNGLTDRPEQEILRLSDAFEDGGVDLGKLELEVAVYNINKGKNAELFAKCDTLRQYADFIAKIREFEKIYKDYDEAVKAAVEFCIANDVLADFLKKNGGKVVSILTAVYDEDVAMRVFAEEQVAENLAEHTINLAKKLIGYNEPIEKIIDLTGLTSAEINQLIAEG